MNIWNIPGYFILLSLLCIVVIAIFTVVTTQLYAVFLAMLVVLLFSCLIAENQSI